VEEIAEPGPMKLYLCDLAIERARLGFAQIEAFAPLNGLLERDNPRERGNPYSQTGVMDSGQPSCARLPE
jgi:hypothetical protein